jgi:hypothetical protein
MPGVKQVEAGLLHLLRPNFVFVSEQGALAESPASPGRWVCPLWIGPSGEGCSTFWEWSISTIDLTEKGGGFQHPRSKRRDVPSAPSE